MGLDIQLQTWNGLMTRDFIPETLTERAWGSVYLVENRVSRLGELCWAGSSVKKLDGP